MMDFDSWRARSPYYGESHEALAQSVRRFVAQEIAPHIDRWEEEGELPRDLHRKAAAAGILGLRYPEAYGGHSAGFDIFHGLTQTEELSAVGAGGLGSAASVYLAAAGVGALGLVDDDRVALSNLNRQILHTTQRVGMPKVHSAAGMLEALNPDCRVEPWETRLTPQNAVGILERYDLVVDGSDNLATRYVVNDVAMRLGKPVVYGAVLRFEGQVSVFTGQPCYRCLFPEAPPPELAPSCEEAGVLGAVPGLIGVLQAIEAIKWLLGIGDSLAGRLLTVDAQSMQVTTLTFAANPRCSSCTSATS